MPVATDGSRICDANRNALAAIDANWVVTSPRSQSLIFCGGALFDATEGLLSTIWYWRREGGAFAILGAGEIAMGSGTVLVDFDDVDNAEKRTNQSGTSISNGMSEWEGTPGGSDGSSFNSGESAESQIAISIANAKPGVRYQLRMEVAALSGTYNLDYPALIEIPIFPTNYAAHPKAKLRH